MLRCFEFIKTWPKEAQEFINDIIIETIKPSAIIVGYDFDLVKIGLEILKT